MVRRGGTESFINFFFHWSAITVAPVKNFFESFYKNKRKEIVKAKKVYFYDTGLRNFIANDFRPLAERTDAGQLIEKRLLYADNKKTDLSLNIGGTKIKMKLIL